MNNVDGALKSGVATVFRFHTSFRSGFTILSLWRCFAGFVLPATSIVRESKGLPMGRVVFDYLHMKVGLSDWVAFFSWLCLCVHDCLFVRVRCGHADVGFRLLSVELCMLDNLPLSMLASRTAFARQLRTCPVFAFDSLPLMLALLGIDMCCMKLV